MSSCLCAKMGSILLILFINFFLSFPYFGKKDVNKPRMNVEIASRSRASSS